MFSTIFNLIQVYLHSAFYDSIVEKQLYRNVYVTVCLPLPLSPHPYMVLPVSQSLLVQSVSALCLDYVPGVSSYVSLYKSVLPHVTCGLLLMSTVYLYLNPHLCLSTSV